MQFAGVAMPEEVGLCDLQHLNKPVLQAGITLFGERFQNEGKNVEISRLSYGIPMGVEIDYLDELTLLNALNDRKKIS